MLFTARKQDKHTFIEAVAFEYLQKMLSDFQQDDVVNLIKGKYPKIQYTTHGYDISGLAYKELVDLIEALFIFGMQHVGEKSAAKSLETIASAVKDRLGAEGAFKEVISDLPNNVFEYEKIEHLSAEDLKRKLKGYIEEKHKTQNELETSITNRTAELEAEKNLLETLLYNASDGVFALDFEGHLVTFNRVMESLTGYLFDEVKGKKADEVVRLFDSSSPIGADIYAPIAVTLDSGNVYSNNKLTLLARNGVKHYIRLVSSIIQERKEINVRAIVTLKDITEDIELENMKLDFVSMAAHELRTPITSIRGYLSLLKDEAIGNMNETHKKYLNNAEVSANNLHILMENLLNISRIERGAVSIELRCLDLSNVVETVVKEMEGVANTFKVSLEVNSRSKITSDVNCDAVLVSEVLSNLLDNAIRYNKPEGRVSIIMEDSDEYVTVHIKDTGVGIPRESQPHIFKKFYRVSGVLQQGTKGTGLGLFISKELISLMGGRIWMSSKFDEGSTFSFSLPKCKSKENN